MAEVGVGTFIVDHPENSEWVFGWELLFEAIRFEVPEALRALRDDVLPVYSNAVADFASFPEQYEHADWDVEIDPVWSHSQHGSPRVQEVHNFFDAEPGDMSRELVAVLQVSREPGDSSESHPVWDALEAWALRWNLAYGLAPGAELVALCLGRSASPSTGARSGGATGARSARPRSSSTFGRTTFGTFTPPSSWQTGTRFG